MIKHINVTAALAAAGLVVVGLSAGQAVAGIDATKHNLSTSGTFATAKSDNPEICVFCHTPHDAIKNNNITLWNHTLSTQGSYGVYTSPSFNGSGTIADVGSGTAATSNLCLSCHDGTVALNAMNNPSNSHMTTTMSGANVDLGTGKLKSGLNSNLGTDLTNDHPVNFTYDAALVTADGGGGLKDPTSLTSVKLFDNRVQCASCHDPHTSTNAPFLRASMTGSGLCLLCHNK